MEQILRYNPETNCWEFGEIRVSNEEFQEIVNALLDRWHRQHQGETGREWTEAEAKEAYGEAIYELSDPSLWYEKTPEILG